MFCDFTMQRYLQHGRDCDVTEQWEIFIFILICYYNVVFVVIIIV